MTTARLEKQTIFMVVLIVALFSAFFAWYYCASESQQHENAQPVQEVAVPDRIVSGVVAVANNAQALPVSITKDLTYTYAVVRNDTLTKIARESCNTIGDIASANHIADINIIYEFQTLVLKKVEPCSPVVAKLKTSPENVLHIVRRASQEKSLSPETANTVTHSSRTTSDAPSAPLAELVPTPSTPAIPAAVAVEKPRNENCASAGWNSKDKVEKILLKAKCIEERYGEFIRSGITEVDQRISVNEVIAVILVESAGNSRAINPDTDCHGLMQLQSPTARLFGVKHIYDPRENILGGIKVLSSYTYEFYGGSRAHGLAAYNMGPGTLNKVLARWKQYDPSTRNPYFREVERIRLLLDEHALPPS
jgi:soluble lytic murein transglycosylase-like protein